MKQWQRILAVIAASASLGVLGTPTFAAADAPAVKRDLAPNPNAKDLILKGDAKCTGCHDEADEPTGAATMLELNPSVLAIGKTRHGTTADSRTPTCIDCHGESEKHRMHKGSGKSTNFNFDASYKLSDKWKMNGWYSRGDTILDLNGTTNAYMAGLRQLGHNLGLGVRGAPTGQLELGADFTFSYEVNRTAVGVIGTSTQPNGLPTAAFRQLNLNLFGKYALDKNADIKVSLAHQRYYSNEWFWNNNGTSFFYSDGTTVTQKDQQNVTFIGAAYIYKFQ